MQYEGENWDKIGEVVTEFLDSYIESFFTLRAPNFCAKMHQNRIKIATVGARTDRQTHRQTEGRT